MKFDLHCHTNVSDGQLSPAQLLERAAAQGVTHLAITDHDTVNAYPDLDCPVGITLIPGIELSTQWRNRGVHIVGLNIDVDNPVLQTGILQQQAARAQRARKIAARLVKQGLPDVHDEALAAAGGSNVGRPHFAQALVAQALVPDISAAFKKYLGDGKVGDVRDVWPDHDVVIEWIRAAGGIAVLAHPEHYKFTRTKLCELLRDFVAAGGTGIEVISGKQEEKITRKLATLADDFGLLASVGSDFHRPGTSWSELGCCAPLPAQCQPVWSQW
ncbi:MAG: PHP domain-containing protein [Woeseia sp.]|nr:PHP domain-containing protein [Woeseia sp.]MBT8096970.1 PHP domain-containing protein [Woeseia sp.]NNE62223.1 PHP domain-containing protein [Woeseia sp.]NNL55913.1 PHP domain-containing protein [Woeseia sp.]